MDYNLNKGKISFWEIINKELNNFGQDEQNRIKDIAKSFEDSVAIMPDEDNNVYAARRLANAILNIDLSQQKEGSIDTITTNVLVKYFSQAQTAAVIGKNHFVPSEGNIVGRFGKSQEATSDDFEKELRSFVDTEIDLIEDLNNSELSVEGLRKKLIIPSNFKENEALPEVEDNKNKFGTIVFSSDNQIEKVICPMCSNTDVYAVSHDQFGCFKCDSEFKVHMEIADNLK